MLAHLPGEVRVLVVEEEARVETARLAERGGAQEGGTTVETEDLP